MKRILLLILSFIALICSVGCGVNFARVSMVGFYESEDARLRVFAYPDYQKSGKEGELVLEDGSIQKISFSVSLGDFTICQFREDNYYTTEDILLKGMARQEGDTVTLYVNDGSKIVLKKVADLPESSDVSPE